MLLQLVKLKVQLCQDVQLSFLSSCHNKKETMMNNLFLKKFHLLAKVRRAFHVLILIFWKDLIAEISFEKIYFSGE